MKARMKNRQAGFTLIEFILVLVIASVAAAMASTFFGSALTQSSAPILRLQKASNLTKVMENIVADYHKLNAINLRYHWVPDTPYKIDSVVTPKTIPGPPNGGHYYRCIALGTHGKSGTTEPAWPTSAGVTVIETGGLTWKESGNIVWQKNQFYTIEDGAIVVPINNNGHYYKCTSTGTSGAIEPKWPVLKNETVVEASGLTWQEAGTILDGTVLPNLKNYLADLSRYGTGYTVSEIKFIQFDSKGNEVEAGTSGTSSEKNILKITIKNTDSEELLTQLFTIR